MKRTIIARSIGSSPFTGCCIALSLTILAVAGCANQGPPGNSAGTIDPYRTHDKELSDRGINTAALLQSCDQAAMAIADRIQKAMTAHDTRVVIFFGDVTNQTRTPASDFDLLRNRIQDRLVNSEVVRDVAMIIEAPEIMDAEISRLSGPARLNRLDEISRSEPRRGVDQFPDSTKYLLNSYFGEATRDKTSTYFLQTKLVRYSTGEIIFSQPFDLKQVR